MHNKLAKFISPLQYLIGNKCPFDSTLYNNIHQLQHKKTKWFILKFLLATLNLSLPTPLQELEQRNTFILWQVDVFSSSSRMEKRISSDDPKHKVQPGASSMWRSAF